MDFPKIPKREMSHDRFACRSTAPYSGISALFLWSLQNYRGPKFLNKVSYPENAFISVLCSRSVVDTTRFLEGRDAGQSSGGMIRNRRNKGG